MNLFDTKTVYLLQLKTYEKKATDDMGITRDSLDTVTFTT